MQVNRELNTTYVTDLQKATDSIAYLVVEMLEKISCNHNRNNHHIIMQIIVTGTSGKASQA
jgi:hypothetical protein